MADSKAVDGVVDELLLGDGFSIVDSTKGDGGNDAVDSKKKTTSKSDKEKEKEKEKKPEAKKEKAEEKTPKKDEKEDDSSSKEEIANKDDAKVNGHDIKSDALLITTEEDLDLTEKDKKSEADPKEEAKKDGDSKEKEKEKEKPADKRKQGDVWVSNITRHVKATDLKKHFSKHGKVLTAKIVTNGKSFFGYILMENSEIANKCVRSLHGSSLDGRKLTVSRQRPDQRRTISERKPTVKVVKTDKKVEKKSVDKEKKPDKKDDALLNAKRTEERLRREIDYNKRELARMKRYLSEEQRRVRIEQQKNRTLGRELQEAEAKLREERRKIDRERELFEKNQRTDRVKLENDRSMMKKELEEVKKLREYLKRKLEEEQSRPVERRPRATSPYAYSSKRFRESSSGDNKGSKYVEERTRTPPSPPKLSSRSKRSPVNSFSLEKERRGPHTSHHYSMSDRDEVSRHSSSMVMPSKPSAPAAPRNIWPSFHQEVWRMAPGTTSTPFSSSGQSSYQRQSDYNSTSSSNKGPSYSSSQREFSKRDHYTSSSVRKY